MLRDGIWRQAKKFSSMMPLNAKDSAVASRGLVLHFMVRHETSLPTMGISSEIEIALSLILDVIVVRENHGVPLPLQQALNSTPGVNRPAYEMHRRLNLK